VIETIDPCCAALEQRIRDDMERTGPAHDDAALDRPHDPDADWQPIAVEEIVTMHRAALEVWRDLLLLEVFV